MFYSIFSNLDYRQKVATKFALVLNDLLELKEEFDQLNRHLSFAAFITTITNGITLSASFFLIFEQYILPKMDNVLWIISVDNIAIIMLDISLSCWASQTIINQINGLIDFIEQQIIVDLIKNKVQPRTIMKYQKRINEKTNKEFQLIDDIEYFGLNRLNAMKKSFCFNVLDMFTLNHTTILHFMSSVVSNSILLIQTK